MKLKNFLLIATLAFLIPVTFSSCDSWFGVNFTEKASLAKFQKKIPELVTPEMKVNSFRFSPYGTSLTSVMGYVTVVYADPSDSSKQMAMEINLSNWKVMKNEPYKFTFVDHSPKNRGKKVDFSESGVSLGNFDLSNIPDMIEKGASIVVDQDLNFGGIGSFEIKFNPDPEKVTYKFQLNGKPKSGGTSRQGRRIVTTYYKIQFTADAKGNVSLAK